MSRLRRQSGEDPELGALSFAKRQHRRSYDARAIQTAELVHLMRVTMIDEHVGQNHGSDLEPAIEQLRLSERMQQRLRHGDFVQAFTIRRPACGPD